MTKNPTRTLLVSLAAAAAVLGCATPPSAADVDKATADAIKSSFRAEGIAGMDRLVQDDSNRECSLAEATGKPLTEGGVRLGYIWGNGKYEAALFGRNITNQIRIVGGIDFDNLTGFINEPRMWGAQFRASF